MIRDGFKDEKKVSSRENRKKIALGERNFYAKEIVKLRDLNKSVSFSNHFTLIVLALAYVVVLLMFILTKDAEENAYSPVRFAIWSAVIGAFLIWYIVWFALIKPANVKKAEKYKKELERISRASVDKVGGAYKIYGSDYIEKLRKQNAELKPAPSATEKEDDVEKAETNEEASNGEQNE